MKKVYPDAKSALADVLKDGMMIMSGGFGLCGIAETLSDAIRDSGVKGLTVISNNAGVDGIGLSRLRAHGGHASVGLESAVPAGPGGGRA